MDQKFSWGWKGDNIHMVIFFCFQFANDYMLLNSEQVVVIFGVLKQENPASQVFTYVFKNE